MNMSSKGLSKHWLFKQSLF